MPKKIPYLTRRGNVFYLRVAVPAELRDTFQQREFTQTLNTECRREAVPKAFELASQVKKLFNETKPMDLKTKRRLFIKDELRKLAEARHQDELEQKESQHTAELRRATAEAALKAENELLKQLVLAGGQPNNSPATSEHEPVKVVSSNSRAPMLSTVFDEYVRLYKGSGSKGGEENLDKIKTFGGLFISFIGERKIDAISQKEVNQFFRLLTKYPGGRGGLSAEMKKMSFLERIEHAEKNNSVRTSPKTYASNYLSPANLFFTWLKANYEDYAPAITLDHINYTQYGGQRDKGEDKQRALKIQEIKRLMCSEKMISYAGNFKTQHQYWLPMIGLFTGARVNEICQLNPQHDISKDESTGLWFFDFTEETPSGEGVSKSHKNESSKRRVPMHPTLLKCGFEGYFHKIKAAGHDRMFNAWKPKDGKASYRAEEFFRDYLRAVGLRDDTPKKKITGMHSLRSTFISHCAKCLMESGLSRAESLSKIQPVVGHADSAVDERGNGLDMTNSYLDKDVIAPLLNDLTGLSAIIEKLDYGIDFPAAK